MPMLLLRYDWKNRSYLNRVKIADDLGIFDFQLNYRFFPEEHPTLEKMHLPRGETFLTHIFIIHSVYEESFATFRGLRVPKHTYKIGGNNPRRSAVKELYREAPYVLLLSITDVQRARAKKKRIERRAALALRARRNSRHRRCLSVDFISSSYSRARAFCLRLVRCILPLSPRLPLAPGSLYPKLHARLRRESWIRAVR